MLGVYRNICFFENIEFARVGEAKDIDFVKEYVNICSFETDNDQFEIILVNIDLETTWD